MKRELEERNQGCFKSLTSFIRIISDFYDRLNSDASETEKIARIIKQMHPEYRAKITAQGKSYKSMHELIEDAYQAQASIKLDRSYREPKTYSNIEPTLAYKIPHNNHEKNTGKNGSQVHAFEKRMFNNGNSAHGFNYGPRLFRTVVIFKSLFLCAFVLLTFAFIVQLICVFCLFYFSFAMVHCCVYLLCITILHELSFSLV